METAPASEGRGVVCAEHGLRVAPDGLCVLCRRGAALSEKTSLGGVRWFFGALGLAALGLCVFAFVRRDKEAIEPAPVRVEVANESEVSKEASERERELERARRNLDAREARERRNERPSEPSLAENERREVESDAPVREGSRRTASPEAVRAALAQVNVRLYTTSWCRYCKQARAFLEKNRVRFTEFDIEVDAAAKEKAKLLNPKGGVPVLEVEGVVLTGFSETSIARALASAVERRVGVPVTGMTAPD